jgi:predicted TIM-barrel fold metal-dependent hydrolase
MHAIWGLHGKPGILIPMPPLYDVHTHVGVDLGFYLRGWWPYAATAQDLLTQMDANGIQNAVCFPFTLPSAFDVNAFVQNGEIKLQPNRSPFDHENALLRQELDRIDPNHRLLQFAMFDPARCVHEQVRLIEPLIGRIKGLKSQTTVLESPISRLLDDAKPLMQLAQKHNLPVLFHTAVAPKDSWAQAADCLAVARAYPDVRFNLAHSLRFDREYLQTAASMPNVWVDCAAHLAHCQLARENSPAIAAPGRRLQTDYANPVKVLETLANVLKGKCLWGSDNPYMSWCSDTMRVIYSYAQEAAVLHALPPEVKEQIASKAPYAWLFGK